MRFFGLLLSLSLLPLAACRDGVPVYAVSRIEVRGETVDENALLQLDRDSVRGALVAALRENRRFRVVEPSEKPEGPVWRVTLELPFTREATQEDGTPHAEVGATLTLQLERGEGRLYEVAGLGDVALAGATPAARTQAQRAALVQALRQVSASSVLHLEALGKPDAALMSDLKSVDERTREYALRTLADRGHPAAAPALIARLHDTDAAAVRSAIGALVEMRARSAVPELIDLARGKDYGFVQELVFAIGEIGGEEAEAYLYTVAQGHDQPTIQAAAQQALDTLAASRKLSRTSPP